jgi:parallel beta-helix repeat protein
MIGSLSRPKGWRKRRLEKLRWGGRGLIFAIIFLIALFHVNFVCWATPGGSVRYADPNTRIQQVIDESSAGDTVLVRKGYYREGTIFLKEGISLVGMAEDVGEVVISVDPNGPTGPVIEAASHTSIENLVIRDGEVGICGNRFYPATDITINHNLIIRNRIGILLAGSDRISLTNTTVADNSEAGVLVLLDPNGLIFRAEENIIAFNSELYVYGSIGFIQQENAEAESTSFLDLAAISLSNNNLYDGLYHIRLHKDGSEEKIPLLSPEIFGPGNFSANPCFVDPTRENYHLLSYSPCIDRADPGSDHLYEPWPNGGRANLGFYGNTPQAAPSLDFDDDGLYDYQEGIEDLDVDSLPDWQDADSAVIPLPLRMDKLSLHLQGMNHDSDRDIQARDIRFKDVQVVLPSDLAVLSSDLALDPPEVILPLNLIQWKVSNLEEGAVITVKMHLPQDFHALGVSRYLALTLSPSKDSSWQSLPFQIDQNEKAITYTIEDGGPGDGDGTRNGVIEHTGGLTTPESMSWKNPKSCFIALVNFSPSSQVKVISRVAIFWVIFFIFLIIGCFLCGLIQQKVLRKYRLPAFLIFISALLISIVALLFPCQGWSQVKEDIEITSSPHPVGSGARALGMAGAFIGVADDATAASWNPAGLKHLGRPEISWVEAYSSRRERYEFEESPEASGSYWLSGWNANYLSLSCQRWFGRLKRNVAFSLSYQHLYDFSKKISSYRWKSFSEDPYRDMEYQASDEQSGGLRALSLASSVDIIPSRLTFGLTANIWSDKLSPNEWIEKYHKDGQGIIGEDRQSVLTHADVLEKYTFSGLNFNLGLLWDISETLTLGAVYKTPFTADLEHITTSYRRVEYSPQETLQETLPSQYDYSTRKDDERLSMPRSYGIGLAYQPLDQLVIDLDIYRTEWGEYELSKANGSRINPITGYSQSEVNVKPTHQIRLGGEYVWATPRDLLPTVRGGVFYDPAPAPSHPDDFYGVSLGFGLTIRDEKEGVFRREKRKEKRDIMSIDAAYQYRWGKCIKGETIQGEHSAADIDHHLFYLSAIYYL